MEATQRELARPIPVLLVVDDDAAVLNSLKFSLEIEGFIVRIYCDGESLLNDPDLPEFGCLVIDHYMPDMTGLDLLARLRSRNINLPAILMSGHPSLTLRRRAAEAGVPLVEKPLLGSGLVDTVRGVLATTIHH